MTTWLAGMRMTSQRLNDNTVQQTTSAGLTAATNFTVSSFSGRKLNGITTVTIVCLRNATALTAGATGAITATLVCTLPVGWRPPEAMPFFYNKGGVADGAGTILPTGTCTITSMSPTATGASSTFTFVAQWISENS